MSPELKLKGEAQSATMGVDLSTIIALRRRVAFKPTWSVVPQLRSEQCNDDANAILNLTIVYEVLL